ncbi:MAG: hypothetical protein DRI75_10095 [Bacteroidetes bacterium]|nr:MAG: hypothetical protein DRI75_10095 [Bacteroidota bacterium]
MKKTILILLVIISFCSSCKKEINPFLISKHNIGHLTDSTQVKDLESVFINDSIFKYVSGDEFTGNINDIEIYEKGGVPLLVLSPSQSLDSTATIRTVKVVDPRFATAKGLSINSTFKDINTNYKVSNIQNSLRNVIVSVNEINAYFTINKNELPANMRFDMNLKIEAIQIPDEAKIKGFYLYWLNK